MSVLVIDAAGAVTPIGACLEETAISLEAGICRFRSAPYVGFSGARYIVAPVVELRPELSGVERGLLLVRPALAECLSHLATPEPIAVMLCIERSPPLPWEGPFERIIANAARLERAYRNLEKHVVDVISEHGQSVVRSEVHAHGPGSATSIFSRAIELLSQGPARRILLVSVSRGCEPAELEWQDLLMRAANPSDRYPGVGGEAGVVLALSRGDKGVGIAGASVASDEERTRGEPTRANALTSVVEGALAGVPTHNPHVLLDVPDSRSLGREWATACMRTLGASGFVPDVVRPVASLGQQGVATIPLYVALARATGRLPALVVSVSEGVVRAAVSVQAVG